MRNVTVAFCLFALEQTSSLNLTQMSNFVHSVVHDRRISKEVKDLKKRNSECLSVNLSLLHSNAVISAWPLGLSLA